jgi:hypothetical protein
MLGATNNPSDGTTARQDQMRAHFEIRRVLERYCRGIDRLDKELIYSAYWAEATDNHGAYIGPALGFSDFIIPVLRDMFDMRMHQIGQASIEVDGSKAVSDTYVAEPPTADMLTVGNAGAVNGA